MSRADDIYKRIIAGGHEAIRDFVIEREYETFFLDFKRSASDGESIHLHASDRRNLAKAISGFGNSEGGVVVWGIDCSRDQDGADVARLEVRIRNPRRFASQIEGAISGLTTPPHGYVHNHVIDEDGYGFVATLIPKSNQAPHQCVAPPQFYIRAGSDFIPAPHAVLAGLFGRRPQPHVFPMFTLGLAEWAAGNLLKCSCGLMVANDGPGIATDLFAVCTVKSKGGSRCRLAVEANVTGGWIGNQEFGVRTSLITKADVRLPPGASLTPLTFHFDIAPPVEEPLEIVGKIGSGSSEPYAFELFADARTLEAQYQRYASAPGNRLPDDLRHEITSAVFARRETTE